MHKAISLLKVIDVFKTPVNFNYKGSNGKKTAAGGVLTLFVYFCYFIYLRSKFVKVGSTRGDQIQIFEEPIDSAKLQEIGHVSLNDTELSVAFRLMHYGKPVIYTSELERYISIVQLNQERFDHDGEDADHYAEQDTDGVEVADEGGHEEVISHVINPKPCDENSDIVQNDPGWFKGNHGIKGLYCLDHLPFSSKLKGNLNVKNSNFITFQVRTCELRTGCHNEN